MRTGRLSISRGHRLQGPAAALDSHLTLVPPPAEPGPSRCGAPQQAPPATADYHLVHDRLTALERLTRLFELGALSAEEFAREKSLILALPAEELVLREAAPISFLPAQPRPPSLLGRMLNWKFLFFCAIISLGIYLTKSPGEALRFFDQLLRAIGA